MEHMSFEAELEKYGSFAYTTVGDSMRPLLRQGKDVVVIERPAGRLKKYDAALYKRDNGKYVLHRVLKVRQDDYVFCGDNQWIREYGITDRHIIGVLTEVVRDGKTVRASDLQYRCYVHLWCDLFYLRCILLRLRSLLGRLRRRLHR